MHNYVVVCEFPNLVDKDIVERCYYHPKCSGFSIPERNQMKKGVTLGKQREVEYCPSGYTTYGSPRGEKKTRIDIYRYHVVHVDMLAAGDCMECGASIFGSPKYAAERQDPHYRVHKGDLVGGF